MHSDRKTFLVVATLPDSLLLFRRQLLVELVERGYRVVTCAAHSDPLSGMAGPDVAESLRRLGVDHRPIPMARTGTSPAKDLRTTRALVSLCREVRPDVMLAYTAKAVIYGSLAGALTRVPRRVAMLTGLGAGVAPGACRGLTAAVVRLLYRWSLARCHGVIFHNSDDRDFLLAQGLLPADMPVAVVNGSGVDLVHFAVTEFPKRPTTFLLVARLLREKGVLEYVEAARQVRAKHPSASFLLAGPVDTQPTAVTPAQLKLWQEEGVLTWLGAVEDVRVPISACSVYVLPSYHEGLPRTVLEAMALGRPIITTNAPGCRETVVDGRNGFLVPVGDAHALARAMLQFVERPELIAEFGRSSRQLAESRFDVRAVNAAMLRFLGV